MKPVAEAIDGGRAEQDQRTKSVKLGFTVTRMTGGGAKFKFLSFSLGAEAN